ncbi:MAG: HAD family hydrolase [Gammaproteobacteria bacterium]|nr:MAG: HAD family hydrolase [Gammaproteobacteria bacterium]
MSLAIFDLDNTLLRGDSDYAWGQFLIEHRLVDGEAYRRENERYYAQYQAGTLDIAAFLAFSLRPLANQDRATLDAWHREYMQTKISPMITPQARVLVKKHRTQGNTLVIVTSTNRFITAPIAKEFGVEHLLATELEEENGRFTGKVAGIPCFREGKVKRLRAWLKEHNETLKESWCYSDSHNDIPLLKIVENPVAVNPDEQLQKYARGRGWPIITLR